MKRVRFADNEHIESYLPEQPRKKIESIQFSLLSASEIRKMRIKID